MTNPISPAPFSEILTKRLEVLTDSRDTELMTAYGAWLKADGGEADWEAQKADIRKRWRGDVFDAVANVLAQAEGTLKTILDMGAQLGVLQTKMDARKIGTGKV